ncbi:hypothetical protein ACOMCU_25175 [Lysinibacillus sp. UGB7]|uniref:hypothetical protein n=1 Tax=Lysinibacillus sp. UGB7 TaxID=3411039 RepID=UPI003B80414E
MFKFKSDNEIEIPYRSIKDTLEDIDKDSEMVFEKSYQLITTNPRAKISALCQTVIIFILWFILFDFYRYYIGTLENHSPLSNLYNLISVPKENLLIEIALGFINTYLSVFCLGIAIAYLLERIILERHLSNKSLNKYLKRRKRLLPALLSIPFSLIFSLFILDEMKFNYVFLRDLIVYLFMFITIYIYRYNRIVFKFSYYMKKQVLTKYLEAIELLIEEAIEEEKENKDEI